MFIKLLEFYKLKFFKLSSQGMWLKILKDMFIVYFLRTLKLMF